MKQPANSTVARCEPLANATRNSDQKSATESATLITPTSGDSPTTGRELRAQLRAHLRRNSDARRAQAASPQSCAATEDGSGPAQTADAGTERRRAKALALLAENPGGQYAMVAEAGDPAIIGIAVRSVVYGEFEITGVNYDGLALLALLERHSSQMSTVH